MFRLRVSFCIALVTALLTGAGEAAAQNIERGQIKSIDVAKKTLVVVADGKERTITISDQTRVFDAQGDTLAERLKGFEPGRDVFFRVTTAGDVETAEGLKLAQPGETTPGGDRPAGGQPPAGQQGGRGQQGGEIRRAKVKQFDLNDGTITLTVDGADLALTLTEESRVHNSTAATRAEQFAVIKAGIDVLFISAQRDGKAVLVAIAPANAVGQPGGGPPGGQSRGPVSPDHSHFKPLTELGTEKYQGFAGGLYPEGKNDRPAAHEAAGLAIAKQIKPLDADGKPADDGRVVLLSIGMSNTSQLSDGFRGALAQAQGVHPRFQFVNGAQGGMTAEAIQDPNDGNRGAQYWRVVDERLQQAGVSRKQVQAIWIKQADAGPRQGFPEYPQKLQAELKRIVHVIAERFPNAKLCYLSSRTYGGFATTNLNPEPVAYESGFAVKWLIEEQLTGAADLNFDATKGAVRAPWLSWGPYLWANGTTKRADGFSYEPTDFSEDGTHHARGGQAKGGAQLLKFFQNDSTTKSWFVAP